MIIETTIVGETFPHKVLWECCLLQMETANNTKKGSKYFHIAAMLLAYLTYEAYINFLGDRLFPDVWADGRKFFAQDSYRGLEGKLMFLIERIPLTDIQKDRRPYQTISKLKRLRDFLSHAAVDKYEKIIIHHRDDDPPLFGPYGKLDRLVTPDLANKALNDVREFIEFLHIQAVKQARDIWLGDALEGITDHSSSDSKHKTKQ